MSGNSNITEASSCCSKGSLVEPGVGVSEDKISKVVWRLGISVVLAGQTMMLGLGINMTPPEFGTTTYWVLHLVLLGCVLVVVVLLGGPLFREMGKSITEKRVSVEGLFVLSVLGALVGSLVCTLTGTGNVYYEVVAIVLVIYTIGKTLGSRSREKVIRESNKVKDAFDYAFVLQDDGSRDRKDIRCVGCCCQVVVGVGEAIAVDGLVLSGEGYINETVMTGELEPVVKRAGDFVLAGSYSIDASFVIRPTGVKGSRKLDALIETVEGAKLAPSALQEQADQLMKRFLPLVVTVSLGTFAFWLSRGSWQEALFNNMAVLLVACPCALGLATPLALWRGLWKLSTLGLVSRSGEFLDVLARADRVVFDKTGTLSEEHIQVVDIVVDNYIDEKQLRGVVSLIEHRVAHPIAKALNSLGELIEGVEVEYIKEVPGKGVDANIRGSGFEKGMRIRIGELSLMDDVMGWNVFKSNRVTNKSKKEIYVAMGSRAAGVIYLDEKMRAETASTLKELSMLGLKSSVLTGDSSGRWSMIEGVSVESGLSPEQKVERIEAYKSAGEWVIFMGDGANDAGAMAVSRSSIAMSGGSALTQSTASAVLTGDSLRALPEAIKVSRAIRKSVKGNMIFAVVYNCLGMGLAAMGIMHPVVAALLMLVSSLCVSIRSIRAI